MAAAELRAELLCSIDMEIYKDPVTLPCGHSFCRDCITRTFDHQEEGEYRCPECQQRFRRRPELIRTLRLSNIADACTLSDHEESGIFCTFCDFPVPADKSCLQCETSMCGKHVTRHNMTALEHTLLPPSTDLRKRKCSIHNKILEFYCKNDGANICVSCRLDGDHMRHKVEPLDKAAEHKKEKLKSKLETLRSVQEESIKKIQSLQEHRNRVHEKSATMSQRVIVQFQNARKELEILERVLSDILRQEEMVLLSNTYLIQQLEKKKDELSKRICNIKKLIRMTDPLTILQDEEFENDDNNCKEDTEIEEAHCVGNLQTGRKLNSLLENLSNVITRVQKGIYAYEPTDITLDVTTAGNNLHIAGDLCIAHITNQNYTYTSDRFEYPEVLSIEKFSFGQYYWEVEASEWGDWRVGVSYSSIDRRGRNSLIGDNDKSWCLRMYGNKIFARHNSKDVLIPDITSCGRLRVYLDYDNGRLSFYKLSKPLKHLHTFTANFTNTLHAAFALVVWSGRHSWVKKIKKQTWLQLPIMAYTYHSYGKG